MPPPLRLCAPPYRASLFGAQTHEWNAQHTARARMWHGFVLGGAARGMGLARRRGAHARGWRRPRARRQCGLMYIAACSCFHYSCNEPSSSQGERPKQFIKRGRRRPPAGLGSTARWTAGRAPCGRGGAASHQPWTSKPFRCALFYSIHLIHTACLTRHIYTAKLAVAN